MNRNTQRRPDLFELLTYDERRAAIKKMAASGYGPETISSITKVHVAMVQAIIREPSQPESST